MAENRRGKDGNINENQRKEYDQITWEMWLKRMVGLLYV